MKRFGDIYESRVTKMRVMVLGPSSERAAQTTTEVMIVQRPAKGYRIGSITRASLGSWRRID